VWAALTGVALIVSLLVTSPVMIGPVGVTIWFVALLTEAAALATLALYGIKTYLHLHATQALRLRYSWRQGWLIGGWATSLLALNSLQQLGIKDAILLGLLLLIVEVYVRLRWP
jgi:hypothetical protein